MKGNVAKIETFGTVDGPGIRTVIFMQGCPLRCIFCHNPEMLENKEIKLFTPNELVNFIKKFKPYFGNNGGVTFSGGEPLLQQDFLIDVCKLLKEENINICLDTAGSIKIKEELIQYIDLFLLDIKAIDNTNYNFITSGNIDNFTEFVNILNKYDKKIWLRQVIVPGINDNKKYIEDFKEYIKFIKNVEKVEFLPYHDMAKSKYKELNIPYKLENTPCMDIDKINELDKYFRSL